MVKANNTRTAEDTATREEVDAVSTVDASTVAVFQTAARERVASFFREAGAYVASVDARGGKRGSDAAVQRVIAEALAGLTDDSGAAIAVEPYSHARYSKLSGAYRALTVAGFESPTAAAFDALYALWNVSSSRLPGKARDTFVAGLKRRKSDAARLDAIRAHVSALTAKKAPEAPAADGADTGADVSDLPTPDVDATDAAPRFTVEGIFDTLADVYEWAQTLTDAERIRLAAAFTATADNLTASTVPADVSTLIDAA